MIQIKLSNYKLKKIILHYCVDIEASKTAVLTGINRNTINAYFKLFRSLIAINQEKICHNSSVKNKLFLDESVTLSLDSKIHLKKIVKQMTDYPVYGLFVYDNKVYSEKIFDNFPVTPEKGSSIQVDESLTGIIFKRKYEGILLGMFPNLLLLNKVTKKEEKKMTDHFVIESFWSFSIRRLSKFNGAGKNFPLHLKECEWRWKKNTEMLIEELTALIIINRR